MKKILVINGPNLNMLGKREKNIYGDKTLEKINASLNVLAKSKNIDLEFFQSNHEGEIIDILHDERLWAEGVLINPGAFAHYSYAIRDAISSINIPIVEVHISDINNREDFRKKSVISDVCKATISGKGKNSYLEGLRFLIKN